MTATAVHPTIASALWPDRTAPAVRGAILAILGSLMVAASAQIQIPLWPVPVTGQTFAVLVIGMAYGWRLGSATLALYLLEGVIGLPVFAKFSSGWAVMAGPTGGYIVGFIVAAGIIGWLAERGWDRRVATTAAAMLIGNAVIYVLGLAWLTNFFVGAGAEVVASTGAKTAFAAAIASGMLPFLLGDALKLALAAVVLPAAWSRVKKTETAD